MRTEHDQAGWIKPHELIRAANDPWQILLVPAALLVFIQTLHRLCVGDRKAFFSFTWRMRWFFELVAAAWVSRQFDQRPHKHCHKQISSREVVLHTLEHVMGCCKSVTLVSSHWLNQEVLSCQFDATALCTSPCAVSSLSHLLPSTVKYTGAYFRSRILATQGGMWIEQIQSVYSCLFTWVCLKLEGYEHSLSKKLQ